MARNQDYKTDLYADLRDFDKAVEYVRACAIEGALDIALRDVLAANRPQASSEIREATEAAITAFGGCLCTCDETPHRRACNVVIATKLREERVCFSAREPS